MSSFTVHAELRRELRTQIEIADGEVSHVGNRLQVAIATGQVSDNLSDAVETCGDGIRHANVMKMTVA